MHAFIATNQRVVAAKRQQRGLVAVTIKNVSKKCAVIIMNIEKIQKVKVNPEDASFVDF